VKILSSNPTPAAALDTLFTTETPEGLALALRPAGMHARSYAYLIDGLIRYAVLTALVTVLAAMGKFGSGMFLILMFLFEWFYPVIFELLPGAATPGKRSMGLRVVMDTGLPITPAASLVRNLLRAVDFLPIGYALGLLFVLLRADFKRIGDVAAGTLVVHSRTPNMHGAMQDAPPMAPTRPLSTREQSVVVAWAERSGRLTPDRLGELALLASSITEPATPKARRAANPELATRRLLGVAQWLMGKR
jgi:uncharacterized RDD family membrane protein YckC